MRIVFLGTNGWYDTNTGNTICTLVRAKEVDVVFDAGYGIAKLDRYLDGRKPVVCFLSHFHVDHVAGLHVFNKFRFPRGMMICGPAGSREILDRIAADPFTVPLSLLPFPVRVLEMPMESECLPFPVMAKPLRHTTLTLGYRLVLDGRVIAYCPDTGYCENAVRLGQGADLLIAECAYRSGQSSDDWPHLTPETAARIAQEAGAKRLALTHFDATLYPRLEDRRSAARVARRIFRNAFAARDDMEKRI